MNQLCFINNTTWFGLFPVVSKMDIQSVWCRYFPSSLPSSLYYKDTFGYIFFYADYKSLTKICFFWQMLKWKNTQKVGKIQWKQKRSENKGQHHESCFPEHLHWKVFINPWIVFTIEIAGILCCLLVKNVQQNHPGQLYSLTEETIRLNKVSTLEWDPDGGHILFLLEHHTLYHNGVELAMSPPSDRT